MDSSRKLPETTSWPGPLPEETVDHVAHSADEQRPEMTPALVEGAPQVIDRYRILKVLSEGSLGSVYLAHDDDLKRLVAIKIPHAHCIDGPADAEAYFREAQVLARLDHPHIVPVHDVGRTKDGLPFMVSKFIEGTNLTTRLQNSRLSFRESVVLVSQVASALEHAHQNGLVHRQINPAHILIDSENKPYLTGFSLALEDDSASRNAGTSPYLSPEQANEEGHRVDARSDIFGLGGVLYEMLTGRRPSVCDHYQEETCLPRQIDPAIPAELERITLKALARRASERYPTARDFAADLNYWLEPAHQAPAADTTPSRAKIVPKGLRSFDAHDADFYLELLPGPRDRDGLPESLRFWKSRIEGPNSFRVGVLYGPSGCGKSSFVKAGLLPRLPDHVRVAYVEATADETEARLLRELQKKCTGMSERLLLPEVIAHLRRRPEKRGPEIISTVIILDQFEQWLHGKNNQENAELLHALRQCDGQRVKCVLMVRDDFWLAVSRFMKCLEVPILEGRNSALVDLFDFSHARKVLTAFGKAYGALPGEGALTRDQEAFLDQAVSGLAQEGKVNCVRLALLADMIKSKPWTSATLEKVGGAEGVGTTFLEESFSARSAPPEHRIHQQAARAVLKALLPEQGTDIKGRMRSHADLREASGYARRHKDFEALLRILQTEVRLITPIDPGARTDDRERVADTAASPYYQLTHDYLVPSLRHWLTRKQKETRKGRAEIYLADQAASWNAKPENRQLPALWHWLQIRWLTRKKSWSSAERKMMRQANRYYGMRALVVAVCLLLVGWMGWETLGRWQALSLRDRLLESTTAEVPGIVEKASPYRRWLDPLLNEAFIQAETDNEPRKQLHASLALLPVDPGQVEYLYSRLLQADPPELIVIRKALKECREERGERGDLTERLWTLLENPKNNQDQRFRASCALAALAPDDSRWEKVKTDMAAMLAIQKPFVIVQWAEAFTSVRRWLLPPLADFLEDEKRSLSERGLVASIYGGFAAGLPDAYFQLEKRLAEKMPAGGVKSIAAANLSTEAKVAEAMQQANIATALLVMGRTDKVWPLLQHRPDPTVRSFLIDRLGQAGVDFKMLMSRLDEEKDVSVKRAILLSLGGFSPDQLTLSDRQTLLPGLLKLYRDDPDPGIHGAVDWLLRQWGATKELQEIDRRLATGRAGKRHWYINRQGQTMMVVAQPCEFWMGEGPERHRRLIGRSFAMASKEVTLEQFLRFRKEHPIGKSVVATIECPANDVSWYQAAEYCNWLSAQDGIPREQWCYLPNPSGKYEAGMKMAPDYLQRTGYRLPTEAEWEYACRAGAETTFCFGEFDDLAVKYGWFQANSPKKIQPVGRLKPNDLGLFDMHGNVTEWTQDLRKPYVKAESGKAAGDNEDIAEIDPKAGRMHRGGDHEHPAHYLRSGRRNLVPGQFDGAASGGHYNVGFRIARTFHEEKPDADDSQVLPEPPIAAAAEMSPEKGRGRRNSLASKILETPTLPQKSAHPESNPITNSIGLKLAYIPPGKFIMGSPVDEKDRQIDEDLHSVELTRGFYMGVHHVTQQEFERVMKRFAGGQETQHCPVTKVSWDEAVEFCRKLSQLPEEKGRGRVYRLPTEAEWEFACRAGSSTPFHFGDSVSPAQGNFHGNYPFFGGHPYGPYRPTKVGSFLPNAHGLYDMHGNVCQWCSDWYDPLYYRNSPERDPPGPATGTHRVLRGGSWEDYAWNCRAASRFCLAPETRHAWIGFRVACDVSGAATMENVTHSEKPLGPISKLALVRQPKPLSGLKSWTIETVPNRTRAVSFSFRPNGRQLATGGLDGAIRIWEPGQDRPLRILLGHNSREIYVAWSPDGKQLASCADDKTLRLWNPVTGALIRSLVTPGAGRALAWSPDGRLIASGGWGSYNVRLWEVASGRPGRVFPPPAKDDSPEALAWSPDGKFLAGMFSSGKVSVWDAVSGQVLHNLVCDDTVSPGRGGMFSVLFAPDGRWLAASVAGGSRVYLWEIPSGQSGTKLEHSQLVTGLAWSSDGQQLISCSYDQKARFWDPRSGKVLRTVPAHSAPTGAFSAGGKVLATNWGGGQLDFFDLETKSLRSAPEIVVSRTAAWSPGGDRLALCSGGTAIWEAKSGRLLHRLADDKNETQAISWAPTGNRVAVAGRQVVLWEPDTATKFTTLPGPAGGSNAVAWSRDGRFLASGSSDKKVRTWEAATAKPLHIFTGHSDRISAVAWSADGQTLASASADHTVRLWDATTGKVRHILKEHKGPVANLAWSADGKTLVSYGSGSLIWWDPVQGRVRHKLPVAHQQALAWSPDGKTLAMQSGGILLFDAKTAQVLRYLQPLSQYIHALAFSPNGEHLLSADEMSVQVLGLFSNRPPSVFLGFQGDGYLALQADGHWRGSPGIEKNLLYIAVTDTGQQTLAYQEFCSKYGWKNEPDRVRLLDD